MKTILRVAIGLVALFMLAVGLGFLFAPAQLAAGFFLSPTTPQGLATLRADFPGFFIGVAVFALIGAWTGQSRPLLVPIFMVAIAFFGRIVSILVDGVLPTTAQPMIVEAVMLIVLLLGWRNFDRGTAR
ncbi:hypothetical protein GCM10011529_00430 [Polymorphobacter glacialis]|uniref:DUF4345 domain-containing protein n=1 Tax=Sandarakinorhabdus glacialis TaxID=1614636 RepID=A0A916ZIB6_9SPHN|nr:DUF4345 family protein [Polymorphobacter glacialis]GGD98305.1 hypothetical protein GCM10011529_00430 [Polymorphobacter glacialis]